MSEVSPTEGKKTVVFRYIIQDEAWSTERQKSAIDLYCKRHFKDMEITDYYREHGICRKDSFIDRPMGHAIFTDRSQPGDILIVAARGLLGMRTNSRDMCALTGKMTVIAVNNRKITKPAKNKRQQFLENRAARETPYGWIKIKDEGRDKVVHDKLERALGKIVLRMLKLRIPLPNKQVMREMAYAAERRFPRKKIRIDSEWIRLHSKKSIRKLRIDILDYLERCPGRTFRAMKDTLSLPYKENERVVMMRQYGYVRREDDGRYFITDAGSAYLQRLRERHAELLALRDESFLENLDQHECVLVEARQRHPLPAESFLEVASQRLDGSQPQLPRSSGPALQIEYPQSSTPTRADQPVPGHPPKATRRISLELPRRPPAPVL